MAQPLLPIIDLHCDLLSYLQQGKNRSPFDTITRCSHPQLKAGNVKLQTMAIFSHTDAKSVATGLEQLKLYQELPLRYPAHFEPLTSLSSITSQPSEKIYMLAAFENASAFADENEPLTESLKRLATYHAKLGRIFYIGFTWDGENRFGGGIAAPQIGLKEDGKRLLDWMHDKNIACDLSHPSDRLAAEIIEYIDKRSLNVPIMASHSNFRAVTPMPRNLPDEIAKEIIHRRGIIGLNFFAPFVKKGAPEQLFSHIDYAFKLKAEDALCFGADFFCDTDFPSVLQKYQTKECFFPEFGDSSKYPQILNLAASRLSLPDSLINKLAWENASAFLLSRICASRRLMGS